MSNDKAAARYQKMRRRVKHVHPMVASTAVEIIMASYEELMKDNRLYAMLKAEAEEKLGHAPNANECQQHWLERNWGKGVDAARATLAQMLAPGMSPGLDDAARESIHEALVLDHSLKMGRKGKEQFSKGALH